MLSPKHGSGDRVCSIAVAIMQTVNGKTIVTVQNVAWGSNIIWGDNIIWVTRVQRRAEWLNIIWGDNIIGRFHGQRVQHHLG